MSFKVISDFEIEIANFFGAPYEVATDCCTHGVELCLRRKKIKKISVPKRIYLSIPMLAHKLNIDLAVSMNQYKYDFFISNSKECKENSDILVCSLEDLLLLKVIANEYSKEKKHKKDVKLILKAIERQNYN